MMYCTLHVRKSWRLEQRGFSPDHVLGKMGDVQDGSDVHAFLVILACLPFLEPARALFCVLRTRVTT